MRKAFGLTLLIVVLFTSCSDENSHDSNSILNKSQSSESSESADQQTSIVSERIDETSSEAAESRAPTITHRSFDYVEMTNGTGDIPPTIIRVGDMFMGLTVTEIVHEQITLNDEWYTQTLSIVFDGAVTLKGTLSYDTEDEFMGHTLWFKPDDSELSKIPRDAHLIIPLQTFMVGSQDEILNEIGADGSFELECRLTTTTITPSYRYGFAGSISFLRVEEFEIL